MYNKKQRIAAWIGIILLVLLYLATLLCAIFDFDGAGRLFQACLFATIAIPILIWIYIYLYGKLTGRRTMASFESEDDYKAKQEVLKSDETKHSGSHDTAE